MPASPAAEPVASSLGRQALELESRQLLAAGPLGINLAGTLGFVDLMKETRAWSPLAGSTLASDANGWPLADAQILVLDERVNQSYNGPDPNAVQPDIGGTYHLSFTGQASLSADFPGNYTVLNQTYNADDQHDHSRPGGRAQLAANALYRLPEHGQSQLVPAGPGSATSN